MNLAKSFSIFFLLVISFTNNALAKNDDTSLKKFDFNKLFEETEEYYRAAKSWKRLKCTPKTGFICDKKSCNKRNVNVFLILDKKAETISRCEGSADKCEVFEAELKQTGVYSNVHSTGPFGTLIRVLGDSRYKEITTIGLDAYIANGNCERIDSEKDTK